MQTSKGLRSKERVNQADRNRGPFTTVKVTGKNETFLDLPASLLVHPVLHVSLLSPVEEEPPKLRRYPAVQDPLEGEEYVIVADLALRDSLSTNKEVRNIKSYG